MTLQKFLKSCVTLGPFGYFIAPGTVGSIIGLLLVFFVYNFLTNIFWQVLFILMLLLMSFVILNKVICQFVSNDPSEIIIDEVIGCFVVFCGIELNLKNILLGFVLFRLLDITKILGIVYLEILFDGPFSILIDDVFAGILTNIILRYTSNLI